MVDRRSLDREIATVALPASLALATEPLYDLADTAILGHLGAASLAGAALAVRLLAFGSAAFVFLMFGTTAAVARRDGADDRRGAAEHGVTAVWLGAALGSLGTVVIWWIGPSLVHWAGARGDIAADARTYLAVSAAGLPATTIVLAGVGFRRGLRDTRLPLLISAATVSLNLALELALVYGAGWGVAASAFGTVVAKWCGAAAYVALLTRDVRCSGASWRPGGRRLRSQLTVGRDLVVRTFLLLGVLAVAQSAASRRGAVDAAGFAIAFQLWTLAAYAVDGLEAAGQSLVAHRLGAGRPDEVAAVGRRVLTWGLRLGLVTGGLVAVTAGVTPHWFTDDTAVVAVASASLWWVAAIQPVNGMAFALDGLLVGSGRQGALALGMAVAAVVFAVVLAGVGATAAGGLTAVWAAMTAFMVARTTTGLLSTTWGRGVSRS